MKIDLSDEERELMLRLLDQVSMKPSPQNLEMMKVLVALQTRLSANGRQPDDAVKE